MLRSQLKFAGAGDDGLLLVMQPHAEMIPDEVAGSCMAIPILSRDGGFPLAIPNSYLLPHFVADAVASDDQALFGPSKVCELPVLEEDDNGDEFDTGVKCECLVIDCSDGVLDFLREYDPVIDPSGQIQPYLADRPLGIVDVKSSLSQIMPWLEGLVGGPRQTFYSAREEQADPPKAKATTKRAAKPKVTTAALAETVSALTQQVQALATQQQLILDMQTRTDGPATRAEEPGHGKVPAPRLPNVSAGLGATFSATVPKVAQVLGPPPRTRNAPEAPVFVPDTGEVLEDVVPADQSPVTQAILRQSAALNSLVAHLATGDPIAELATGAGSSQSMSTKGLARRERMQQDLATGASNYYLQVQQQIHKKMFPARPTPKSESELLASGATLTGYLERFGGYKHRQEAGMMMWMIGHAMDASSAGDQRLCREYLALLTACLEQATLDGNWNIAWVLSLLEEPPHTVFQERSQHVSALGRPFAPLVPSQWSAVCLAYLREIEVLSNKKQESKPSKPNPPKAEGQPKQQPKSPPKRPKFPKKPKGGAEGEATET